MPKWKPPLKHATIVRKEIVTREWRSIFTSCESKQSGRQLISDLPASLECSSLHSWSEFSWNDRSLIDSYTDYNRQALRSTESLYHFLVSGLRRLLSCMDEGFFHSPFLHELHPNDTRCTFALH